MTQILVYADKGVDGGALKQLHSSLKQNIDLSQYAIKRIDAKKLIEEEWEKQTRLLIIPGGRDVFYQDYLQGRGTEKIRHFVQEGGNYLGICAGAYFASESIEFEKGHALEVCSPRSLKFFPGIAKGPIYGNNRYSYESSQGVEAARISWENDSCHIYYNGGCAFEFSNGNDLRVMTLSRYLDLPLAPSAIVQIAVGKGMVILSGVHIEYNFSLFSHEDPHLANISPLLKESEKHRIKIFTDVMSKFGL